MSKSRTRCGVGEGGATIFKRCGVIDDVERGGGLISLLTEFFAVQDGSGFGVSETLRDVGLRSFIQTPPYLVNVYPDVRPGGVLGVTTNVVRVSRQQGTPLFYQAYRIRVRSYHHLRRWADSEELSLAAASFPFTDKRYFLAAARPFSDFEYALWIAAAFALSCVFLRSLRLWAHNQCWPFQTAGPCSHDGRPLSSRLTQTHLGRRFLGASPTFRTLIRNDEYASPC